ncbi:hypothetical protein [Flavobacterium sp.]|uniref:hypothetical protein n=1 Tax=Flavobacterium sp. TaxID=239 RepID=UPI003D6BEE0E
MTEELINIDLYKEIYNEELKTKNSIDSQMILPTNLIVLLIGVGLFMFKNQYFKSPQNGNLYIIIAIGLLFSLFAGTLSLSIMYLMKAYLNGFYKYHYLPASLELKEKENQLKKDYKILKKKGLKSIKLALENHMLIYYIDSSSNNRYVNDERLKAFYLSKLSLSISIILIAIIGFLMIQK